MGVTCVQITEDLALVPCSEEQALASSRVSQDRVWVDLEGADVAELDSWLDRLGFQGFVQKLCQDWSERVGFYPLKRELVLVVPTLTERAAEARVSNVGLVCRDNLLLTWHHGPTLGPSRAESLSHAESWLGHHSVAAVVSALMMDLSQMCLTRMAELRRSVRVLEDRMDRTPDAVEAEDILDLRADLLLQDGIVREQLPSLHALAVLDKPYFRREEVREFMDNAVANMDAADRAVDRLESRIDGLRNGFQMHGQDRTNRRLGTLTILSAIFMPVTLMAGIWGMNFESMPELGLPWAYPIALVVMVVVAIGMFLFFRRGGWLG